MRLRILFLSVISIYSSSGYGQDRFVSSELTKVSKAYLAATDFSADVKVISFATEKQLVGQSLGMGMMRKSKDNYYSKYLDDEMICNNNCTLIIDHSGKIVSYFDKSSAAKKLSVSNFPSMDSLLKKTDSTRYEGIVNGEERFVLYTGKTAILRTELFITPQDHFLRKLIYYYAPNTQDNAYDMYKIEITYVNISLGKVDNDFFSEKKYIDYKNGKPVLKQEYTAYKLHVGDKFNKKMVE